MISNKLFEEIIEISKKEQLLDKRMIRKIVKEIITNTDKVTKRKFSFLKFIDNPDFCAIASAETGELRISLKSCYEDVNDYKNASFLEKNLHILAIILHEMQHLEEIYKVKYNKIEGKLINLSDYQSDYFVDGDVNFDTYYTNPSEKIAYALSYKKLLEFLNDYPNFKNNYPKEYAHINNLYIDRLKYGYKKIGNGRYNVPLIDFSKSLNMSSTLKSVKLKLIRTRNIQKIKRMSLEDRFMYGLPVTKRKVKQLERKKIKLQN